jgi:hypothetical protein
MSGDPDVIITAIYENRVEGGQTVFKGPNQYYRENILDGLRVYHNPFAAHPLDLSLFDRPEVFQANCRPPARLVNLSESRRLLANRTAMTEKPPRRQVNASKSGESSAPKPEPQSPPAFRRSFHQYRAGAHIFPLPDRRNCHVIADPFGLRESRGGHPHKSVHPSWVRFCSVMSRAILTRQ